MEMEHINENLIKVYIGMDDLKERGINFLDLIKDQSGIERFFYSILEEVDIDKHFIDSDAVTFQVMPNQNGLELYISRSDFNAFDDYWEEEVTNRILNHQMSRKKRHEGKQADKQDEDGQTFWDMLNDTISKELDKYDHPEVVKFNHLENFLDVARRYPNPAINAQLYHYQESYYLVLLAEGDSEMSIAEVEQVVYSLLEYGEMSHMTPELLAEHGDLIGQDRVFEFYGKNF